MVTRTPLRRFSFGGGPGGVPRDIAVLIAVLFVTFSLQFFASTAILPALLRLTPAVWRQGFLWQFLTYPYSGTGAPSFWFVLELIILFLFARDVFYRLGRRGFWRLLLWVSGGAALVAVLLQLLLEAVTEAPLGAPAFVLMQGQYSLLVITIAAFATLNREATIYLFFVLPIQAKWFLLLELVFAFMGFLATRDLAGFAGLCACVGITYTRLSGRPSRALLKESWLRLQSWWIRRKLARLRRQKGLRLLRPEDEDDRWVN